MKFAVAAVVLAAVLGIECSVYPYVPALSYTAVSGPALVAAPAYAAYGPSIATIRGPAVAPYYAAPAAVAVAPAPAAVAVAPAVVAPVVAAQGSYIAKTRGAVHVAPLEGHANSAASINLEPAPGTV